MTKKLYQNDVYRKECVSTILKVYGNGETDNPFLLVLDETIFFPTGGGQPCDSGTIEALPLADVFEKDGVIFHKLQPSSDQNKQPLQKESAALDAPEIIWKSGNKVHCNLDWQRRFEHMQRHCGEHILSGIFFRECAGINRGFHMGNDYMTIDIDVPGITWETAQRIETLTNEVIWSDVPVTTRYFEERSDAEKLPLRKDLAIDEDITIVCVGDESNPADCVACCGTHPSTSGQVGLLKILKLESYKGMTRVYFKAGKEALLDYQNKHRILSELNQKYSSDDRNLLNKIKAQDEKNKGIRQELYQFKNAFLTNSINEILKDYNEKSTPLPLVREYAILQANDLMTITRALVEKISGLIALISTQEYTVVLASSGKYDCGKIVKDNAHVWRGKGGGNAGSARALFQTKDDLDCFISFIKQSYSKNR